MRLVTREEESLRRQHLELLLFAARIAAMQQDRRGLRAVVRAADAWLAEFFDGRGATVTDARDGNPRPCAAIDVDPARPQIGAAAQTLQRV